MSDLRELYQQVILDHNRAPRNFRALDGTHAADGHNPLCGDKIHLELILEDDIVTDVAFQGAGCAISTASASLLTEAVKGKPLAEIEQIFQAFHTLATGDDESAANAGESLGKLQVFAGIRDYPMRVKCATLSWHTLNAALAGSQAVSTE